MALPSRQNTIPKQPQTRLQQVRKLGMCLFKFMIAIKMGRQQTYIIACTPQYGLDCFSLPMVVVAP